MNKFVYSALAATLVSTTGFATETEWIQLDRELDAMSATLAPDTGGPQLSGWVEAVWAYSSDVDVDVEVPTANTKNLSGAYFRSVRINVDGSNADYGYHVSGEIAYGLDMLYEAYGTATLGEQVKFTIGQFKLPFLRSGLIAENHTFFITRSLLGAESGLGIFLLDAGDGVYGAEVLQPFPLTERGVMLSGNFERLEWKAALQNGSDAMADDYRITGRLNYDVLGDGAGHNLEGAYNASEGTNLSVAVVGTDDGALDNGTQFGGEVYLTTGPFAAWGEIVDLDDDVVMGSFGGFAFPGNRTPWDVAASYMFTDQYEVGVRYEDMDDDYNTTLITAGVNYYVSGHDVKWQLNWQSSQSDIAQLDSVNVISLGLLVSF